MVVVVVVVVVVIVAMGVVVVVDAVAVALGVGRQWFWGRLLFQGVRVFCGVCGCFGSSLRSL